MQLRSEGALQQYWPMLQVFGYLHMLDILTTLLGLRLGCAEANPFLSRVFEIGPALALAISKAVVIAVAAWWIWSGRKAGAIRLFNYGFAGLVLWNMAVLLAVAARH